MRAVAVDVKSQDLGSAVPSTDFIPQRGYELSKLLHIHNAIRFPSGNTSMLHIEKTVPVTNSHWPT